MRIGRTKSGPSDLGRRSRSTQEATFRASGVRATWTERHAAIRAADASGLDLMLELWREEALELAARRRERAKGQAGG